MEIKDLKQAIVERFKLTSYIDKFQANLIDYAEESILEKYKGTTITRNGLEYELFGVRAYLYSSYGEIEIGEVQLTLTYTIISKIDSRRNKILNNAKSKFKEDKRIGYYEGNIKLWIEETYDIEPHYITEDKVNLNIERIG